MASSGIGEVEYAPGYNKLFEYILGNYINDYHKGKNEGRFLIYLNGGLNGECGVRKQAVTQVNLMKQDGYFPVFLVWDTSLLKTYGEHVARVRKGRRSIKGTSKNW